MSGGEQGPWPPPGQQPWPAWGPPAGSGAPWPQPWGGDRPYGHPHGGEGTAIAALVVGIISMPAAITGIGGLALGLIALVLGITAARRSRRQGSPGHAKAVAGIVTGAIGALLGAAFLAVVILAVFHSNLLPCLRHAAGNTAAIHRCEIAFRHRFKG